MTGQQAAECEPVLLRHLSLCDEQKTGQARFRCQQVVAGVIAAPFAHVVADGQQAARVIVEKLKIHYRQFAATIHQIIDDAELRQRAGACCTRAGQLRQCRDGAALPRLGHQEFKLIPKGAELLVECLRPVNQFAIDIDIRRQPCNQLPAGAVNLVQRAGGGSQRLWRSVQRECAEGVLQQTDLFRKHGGERGGQLFGKHLQCVLQPLERIG